MSAEYTPQDKEAYERMLKLMSNAETQEELKGAVLLYLFDLSYPRLDLLMAERKTRKDKGWL